ncbi:hypothetical protein D9M72_499420 [compost metagenome]
MEQVEEIVVGGDEGRPPEHDENVLRRLGVRLAQLPLRFPCHRLEFQRDAERLQVGLPEFACDRLDRLGRGIGHDQFQARLDALFGKQCLCCLQISFRYRRIGVVAPDAGRDDALGARAEAARSRGDHVVIGKGE